MGNQKTDNTMAKRKRKEGQRAICKTLHRKQNIEQHEPHSKPEEQTVPTPHVAPVVLLLLQTQ